jgi:exodeoxyribonuclease VII large subunit
VPDLRELRDQLERTRNALHGSAQRAADRSAQRLTSNRDRLQRAPLLALERRRARLDTVHARLGALSPLAVLDRGYAIVHHGENVVRAADDVTTGDTIDVRVADGRFGATVE